MRTYKKEDGYFLDVSGLEEKITSKEYTMLNNIAERIIKKYNFKVDRIVGDVEPWCITNEDCAHCPYEAYCDDVTYNFHKRYQKEEYEKILKSSYVYNTFHSGERQFEVLWSNTLEELIHYVEGET